MRIVTIIIGLLVVLGGGVWFVFFRADGEPPQEIITNDSMYLASKNFNNNQRIPSAYTCDGAGSSPQLHWGDAPEGTKSFLLVVVDPDAPGGNFIHWMIQDIAPDVSEIPENGPVPGTEIKNSSGETGWVGPCPPSGEHRYFFKVYALDVASVEGLTKDNYVELIAPHVIADAQLIGLYSRQ